MVDMMQHCMDLTTKNSSLASCLKQSNQELANVRHHLLQFLVSKDNQAEHYSNVKLTKLIDLLQAKESTPTPPPPPSPSSPPNTETKTLPSIRSMHKKLDTTTPKRMRSLDTSSTKTSATDENKATAMKTALEETQQRFLSVQRRCWTLERENKTHKTTISHWKEKAEEVGLHCERLMFHLKQETAAKATAQYTSESLERKVKAAKKRIITIGKERDQIHAKMTLLKQGAEILEGQLRSLDGRFVALRGTLDWSVHHSRGELKACSREFVRLSSQIESYKEKWNDAEDRVRKLDYDVKHLKIKVAAKPQVIHIAAPTKSILDTSSEDEDGDVSDDSEQAGENGNTDGSNKVSQQKGKRKKNKKGEDPTWQYETVSTGGYPT